MASAATSCPCVVLASGRASIITVDDGPTDDIDRTRRVVLSNLSEQRARWCGGQHRRKPSMSAKVLTGYRSGCATTANGEPRPQYARRRLPLACRYEAIKRTSSRCRSALSAVAAAYRDHGEAGWRI